jgi:gliding motility-associated-like protein
MVYSYSARELKNSDIVIAGYSSVDGTFNSDWDCLMLRVDRFGILKWEKIVKTSYGSDWLLDFVELPNGNIIFVGASVVSSVDFLLLKTDPNGNIIKSSTFGGNLNEVIYSVLYINNKLILNAGSWSFGIGEYDFIYSKCDTNFNIEFTKVYGGEKFDFPFGSSYENDEVTVSGYSRSFNSDNNNDIVLFSFNSNGQIIRKKKVGLEGTEFAYTKGQIYTRKNNIIYLTGETSSYGNGLGDILFSKFILDENCCEFISDVIVQEQLLSLSSKPIAIILEDLNFNSYANFNTSKTVKINYTPSWNCKSNPISASIMVNNTSLCTNKPVEFLINTIEPGLSIVWDFGDPSSGAANTSNDEMSYHTYSYPGNYLVTLIVNKGCSSDTDTISIVLIDLVKVETQISSNLTTACYLDTVDFNSISNDNNAKYYWNFNDPISGTDNISTLSHPSHLFTESGTYNVLLLSYNECYIDSDYIAITITNDLISDFNYTIDSCVGKIKLTSNASQKNVLNWYINNLLISNDQTLSLDLKKNLNYLVKLIINPESKCSDTIEKDIIYTNRASQYGIQVVDVFSPNDDGFNDRFELYGNVYCEVKRISIFNRWGEKVYESTNVFEWDGKFKNRTCPNGTYILYLELQNNTYVRTINLLR